MKHGNRLVFCCIALLLACGLAFAQGERGKAELKTPSGSITVDYGRPSLQGRDMLSKLPVGNYWRLGKDEVTVISTPVALGFGPVKVTKGTHGLWLKRQAPEKYELVFNGQVTGHAMVHDAAKDTATVPMTKTTAAKPVETLTIDLAPSANGGKLVVRWGTSQLTAEFQFSK
jgi:hypothetical protein